MIYSSTTHDLKPQGSLSSSEGIEQVTLVEGARTSVLDPPNLRCSVVSCLMFTFLISSLDPLTLDV